MIASGGQLYRSPSSLRTVIRHRRRFINNVSSSLQQQRSLFSRQKLGERCDKIARRTTAKVEPFEISGHQNSFFGDLIGTKDLFSRHAALSSQLGLDLPPVTSETTEPLAATVAPHLFNLIAKEDKLSTQYEIPPSTSSSVLCSTPDFSDTRLAYGSKSTAELLTSLFILHLCRVKPVVQNAERLISLSRRVLGATVTDAVIRHTFFKQFCGGEDAEGIRPTIESLKNHGIGSILDYAAESDMDASDGDGPFSNDVPIQPENQPARVYDYKSEQLCDHHLKIFKSCIRAVRDVSPAGFSAIKITALGNPLLLERLSTAIVEAKKLFSQFDTGGKGKLSHEQFATGYRRLFSDAKESLPSLLHRLDPHGAGEIDYIRWSQFFSPLNLPRIVSHCRSRGPLYRASPSTEEVHLISAMRARAHAVAEEAFENNVRLLIDAEQTRYQPAIDNIVLDLQREFNAVEKTHVPIIFNTYQAYLKDAPHRMMLDLERSERYNYHFAAKLVRGAYMVGERALAAEKGYPSPIHDTVIDTHRCYDECLEYLLRRYAERKDTKLEVMVATHNQASIEKTIALMHELGISHDEETVVHFAQLYGMSDNLTYPLGKHNHRAFKYLPYGSVNEVIPYLVRRGQENSQLFGNANSEIGMMMEELKRRIGLGQR
mmetsp:Transcript_12195/g.15214  ORF Transcript_12195/g.15214 Transcript_12195/m.15214 type:complete len:658 (+) Transcript_12195:72-2045(+)